MTISANRVQLLWSPLLGWALLTCSASMALAQIGVAVPGVSDSPVTTTSPSSGTADGQLPGAIGTPSDATSSSTSPSSINLPPLTTPLSIIPLPAGTTVANPSTQIIPGASDVFAGGTAGLGLVGTNVGGGPSGEELGVTLGSFTLYSAIDITTGLDNNVFATNNTTSSSTTTTNATPTLSLSTIVAPSLTLRSNWLNHSLNVLLGGGFGFYASAPTQNYQNYFLIVDGRVDIREDLNLTYSIGYRRATEALGTANVAFAQAPTVDESIPLAVDLNKRFNKVTIGVGGSATKAWFTDYSTITSAGLDAASRNRTTYEEHLRFGYDVTDDFTVFLAPSISQIRYDQTVDSLGQNRDSSMSNLGVGVTWQINPTTSLSGAIGYGGSSSAGGLGDTSTYTFNFTGSWNGYQPLTIRPNLSRGIAETALSAYRNVVTTVLGVDYSYNLFEEWSLAGGFSYSLTDYQPIDGLGASPRQDAFARASIGILWSPRPQFSIGPIFEYTQGTSSDSTGPAYNRQLISIRLSARR